MSDVNPKELKFSQSITHISEMFDFLKFIDFPLGVPGSSLGHFVLNSISIRSFSEQKKKHLPIILFCFSIAGYGFTTIM